MTPPVQTIEAVEPGSLLGRVLGLKKEGWRIVSISAARLPNAFELLYSFDRDYSLLSLRFELPTESPKIVSVSSVYWAAVLYENELHDLFGIEVEGMAVDFKGNLYKTAVKFPFGSTKPPKTASANNATAIAVTSAVPPTAKN
jgi:ech hydrogenase subunit D